MNSTRHIIIFIVLFSCYGCFGRPDSSFVNIVGKELPNFVDMTEHQKGVVPLSKRYQIIYLKKDYNLHMRSGGKEDRSFLILRNLKTEKEDVLIEGHLGYDIEYAFFQPEENTVLFTLKDVRSSNDITYLCTYDLSLMKISSKSILLDEATYENPKIYLGGVSYISELHFNDYHAKIYFSVFYKKGKEGIDSYDYYLYDLKNQSKTKISKHQFGKLKNSIRSNHVYGYSYPGKNEKLKFFPIVPYSDYLPENYKHKYNGIYVNNGNQNIRISKIDGHIIMLSSSPIWIENGTKIVCGSYVFDATGKDKESKLVDGVILSVRKN